jgi:EAL domain-containing protein (putative c-di-GMP-specific phosphodiesterase class I)
MMIAHTVEVARLLGLKTVAEGVETRPEMQLLESLGCDMIQGFFVSEPMDGRDLLRWMLARRADSGNASRPSAPNKLFGT